jgi:hypothetical protein
LTLTAPSPVSADALPGLLAQLCVAAASGGRIRVALDGSPAAEPGELADAMADPLRALGAQPLRVRAAGFLRPASLRYEFGKTHPDSYYGDWLDTAALSREVLRPLAPGGSGRWLPSLWNADTDRATRAAYEQAPEHAVLLVDGVFLLGRNLPFDLAIHVHTGPPALARRTPPELAWTLPAYQRYADEVAPLETADVVVRRDDPRHPAVQFRA